MASPNETNQQNAQHSTGPKSPEGKQRSSQNALTHGLTAQTVLLPTDDLDAYQSHVNSFFDEYNPQGSTEDHLVQTLADTAWRQNRVASLEGKLLADPDVSIESQIKALANLGLHSHRLTRQFQQAAAELRAVQQLRISREHSAIEDLLNIMEIYKEKGETYDPSKDGFVFTESQIKAGILARARKRLALQARKSSSV